MGIFWFLQRLVTIVTWMTFHVFVFAVLWSTAVYENIYGDDDDLFSLNRL